MAVVNINSVQLTNAYSQPVVLSNSFLAGAGDKIYTDVAAMGATDSANSTYRFFRIPSNALVLNMAMVNDANTGGTSYKIGILAINGGGVVVTGSDAIFVPAGLSLATARTAFTNVYSPAIASVGTFAVVNVAKRVWELLGLTADPVATYEVVISAVTPGTAGGNVALRASWTQ